jgi:uncharacterized protein (TIGR03086 family)
VRELLNHLVGGNLAFAAILTGHTPPDRASEHLGDDPATAYRQVSAALLAAFAQPGALETVITVPIGTVPGIVALHLRITESLVHGWDLARATNQPTHRLPDDLAEQELAFTRRQLPQLPPDRRPFADPQPAPDDAPALDRLVALLGRTPTARAPGADLAK